MNKKNLFNKNKEVNLEILAVMDYYNSGMTKTLHNNIVGSDFIIELKNEDYRKIIGFSSTGIYDYQSCSGKGVANILIEYYKDIYQLKQKFKLDFLPILLRKKTSNIHYLIQIDDY